MANNKGKGYLFKRKQNRKNNQSLSNRLLSDDTAFHVKEAYKSMRTNIMFSAPDEGCKVIGVNSAIPGEGKSTTILNLAITFAETGTKVLLIDADMRRPNIKKILNAGEDVGLAEILARFIGVNDGIKPSGYDNLDVIFSGGIPPNPVELLASDNMGRMIGELKENYDYIFIDSPPINVVTDVAVVSRFLHGIILVARENISRKDEIAEALNKLKFVNAKVIGFVLNDREYHSKQRGRYGKYKRYYHNYENEID